MKYGWTFVFAGFGIWILIPLINMAIDIDPITKFIMAVVGSGVAIFGMYLDKRDDRKNKLIGEKI